MTDPTQLANLPEHKTSDYFLIEEIIARLETSEEPDLEKCKLLYDEALSLYRKLKLQQNPKIEALKWEANQGINKSELMPVEDAENEIKKAVEERRIDSKADELIKTNAVRLAIHYKFFYYNLNHIRRFVSYNLTLLGRIINTVKVAGSYKLKDEITNLREELDDKENKIFLLEEELKKTYSETENIKEELKKHLLSENTFKLMGKLWSEKINDGNLVKVLLHLLFKKTTTIRRLYAETYMTPSDVKKVISIYPEFFKFSSNSGEISLNYDLVNKEEKTEFVEKKIETIEEQPTKPEVIGQIKKKLKSLFKKKNARDKNPKLLDQQQQK